MNETELTDADRQRIADAMDSPLVRIPAPLEPLALVQAAIAKGMDPNAILDFIERVKQSEAEAAYTQAMVAAQAEMPPVVRTARNDFLKSLYAKLEALQQIAKPVYTKHGFSLSWGEDKSDKPGFVRVICDVMHAGGHTKRYQGDYPLDGSGTKGGANMNALQGRVSSNTYAQRDMLRGIFNLTIADVDDDGNLAGGFCSDEQITMIRDLLQSLERGGRPVNLGFWLKWLKADSVESIRMADFDKAILDLNQRRKEKHQ